MKEESMKEERFFPNGPRKLSGPLLKTIPTQRDILIQFQIEVFIKIGQHPVALFSFLPASKNRKMKMRFQDRYC